MLVFSLRRVTIEEDTCHDSPPTMTEEGGDGGKGRKGIFKKKSTSSSITSVIRKAPSVSSVYDDQQEVIPNIHTVLIFSYIIDGICYSEILPWCTKETYIHNYNYNL